MGIRYEIAEDIQREVNEIAETLFPHVKLDSVVCLRSHGSSSRGTIARCHALGKAMQLALGRRGFYVIEVISRRFDKMSSEDKTKTLIHELMHIPKSFGGGFIHHDIVHERNVERMYQRYCNLKGRNKKDPRYKSFDSYSEENITPGQKIEREFFIVLEKKDENAGKKRSWWS
jgi:predicted metallopeptidase